MKLSAVLLGAVGLASGAYALGTQSDDGSAVARSGNGTASEQTAERGERVAFAFRRGPGPDLSALADELGVEEDALRNAIEDVRDELDPPRRDREDPATRLAQLLNVSAAKVRSALQDAAPRGGPCGPGAPGGRGLRRGPSNAELSRLANEIGVSTDALRNAFTKLRQEHEAEHRARRNAFAEALARKLNLDADKVKEALEDARPMGPPPGPPPGP